MMNRRSSKSTKWPRVAYHFHLDREVTITEAIEMRENGDLRAGDLWCHADCYKTEPRTGNKRWPRNRQSCPHYWNGPSSGIRAVDCRFEGVMHRKDETWRFAQFYHDLLIWLNSDHGAENPADLFHISEVRETNSNAADLVISHTESAPIDWTETSIIIVDKNRRREAINEYTLVIDISQWTDSHLAEFNNSGIRKMIAEWNQLVAEAQMSTASANDFDEIEEYAQWSQAERDRYNLRRRKEEREKEEEEWIKNNQSYISQAHALHRRTKAEQDNKAYERDQLLETSEHLRESLPDRTARLDSSPHQYDVGQIIKDYETRPEDWDLVQNQILIDDCVRSIRRRRPLLKLDILQIARKIKEADDKLQTKIRENYSISADDHLVKIGHYQYRLSYLQSLGQEETLRN